MERYTLKTLAPITLSSFDELYDGRFNIMYAILVESDTVYCYDVIETQKGEEFYIKEDGFPFKYKKQMAFNLKLFKTKESAEVYSKNWEPPWWVKPIAFKIVEVPPRRGFNIVMGLPMT